STPLSVFKREVKMKTTIFSFLLLIVSGYSFAQNEGIHIKISKKQKVDTSSIYIECMEKYVDYHFATLNETKKLYILGDSNRYNLPPSIRGIELKFIDAEEFQILLQTQKRLEYVKIKTTYSQRHKNYVYMRRAIIIETIQGKYRLRILKHKRYHSKFKKNHGAWFYCNYNVQENKFTLLLYVLNK
ncbi:hypothetical protein, partial [Lishizhenia sp.]|uniref:hypothetical protein n=1 Tax=Lishizhenia sp. TaxID=2497594 RepID=UPI00299CDBF1